MLCADAFSAIPVWPVVLALAAPHFLYAFIWFKPSVWLQAFSERSVEVFASTAWAGKVLQLLAVVGWLGISGADGLCGIKLNMPYHQWLVAVTMLAVGQALNYGIYAAIGTAGVYYGGKLGRRIPWCSSFPFDTVKHPQYVGSVLSVWALAVLLQPHFGSAVVVLALYWTALYLTTGIMEDVF